MNVCILTGRLTKDPHKTEKGAYFTLAVDHDYKDEDGNRGVDFLPISVYGKTAEHVCKYLTKGDMINVIARAASYRKDDIEKVSFKLQRYEFVKVKYFEKDCSAEDLQADPGAELPEECGGYPNHTDMEDEE